MPPAFVLSQDQTLKFDLQSFTAGENPLQTTEISKDPGCTIVNYYMDICVKDICAVDFFGNPILCALKPQKPGPPPTCPFI